LTKGDLGSDGFFLVGPRELPGLAIIALKTPIMTESIKGACRNGMVELLQTKNVSVPKKNDSLTMCRHIIFMI
jgi:hypothetical protein